MTDEPVYRRGHVLWRRTLDRVIILVPTSGEFLTLQGTGCGLWNALERPGSLSQLAQQLSEAYGVSAEQVATDITPVIEELARYGAVDLSDTCPSPGVTGTA